MPTDNTIILNNDNYYSTDANKAFMSVSQFKDFAGTLAHGSCEESALKRYKGELPSPKSVSLLVGSYIDSYFEGTLDTFKTVNSADLFKKTGDKGLKAEFVQAETIINRINSDPLFSAYMSGQKQVIMTADLFGDGTMWKIKMDSYHPGEKIVDLKVMKDMNPIYAPRLRRKTSFVTAWGYDIQGAVYQKVVEIVTGKKLPFYICCATKEKRDDEYVPNIDVIEIEQKYLDDALDFVKDNIAHVLNVKNEIIPATRCGDCTYCRKTKTLSAPTSLTALMNAQNLLSKDENTDTNKPVGLFDD